MKNLKVVLTMMVVMVAVLSFVGCKAEEATEEVITVEAAEDVTEEVVIEEATKEEATEKSTEKATEETKEEAKEVKRKPLIE